VVSMSPTVPQFRQVPNPAVSQPIQWIQRHPNCQIYDQIKQKRHDI
jgi:hypothetical protein